MRNPFLPIGDSKCVSLQHSYTFFLSFFLFFLSRSLNFSTENRSTKNCSNCREQLCNVVTSIQFGVVKRILLRNLCLLEITSSDLRVCSSIDHGVSNPSNLPRIIRGEKILILQPILSKQRKKKKNSRSTNRFNPNRCVALFNRMTFLF